MGVEPTGRGDRARSLSKRGGRAACRPLRRRRVDLPGIEPGSPPCHSGVFPLDHKPSQWNGRESNPDLLFARQTPRPPRPRAPSSSAPCLLKSGRGGSRTHNNQALDLTPLPVGAPGLVRGRSRRPGFEPGRRAYQTRRGPARRRGTQLQTWESNPAGGLMRPARTPARLQFSRTPRTRTGPPRS